MKIHYHTSQRTPSWSTSLTHPIPLLLWNTLVQGASARGRHVVVWHAIVSLWLSQHVHKTPGTVEFFDATISLSRLRCGDKNERQNQGIHLSGWLHINDINPALLSHTASSDSSIIANPSLTSFLPCPNLTLPNHCCYWQLHKSIASLHWSLDSFRWANHWSVRCVWLGPYMFDWAHICLRGVFDLAQ